MNIEDVKQIPIADYLHSLGYSPVKQQGKRSTRRMITGCQYPAISLILITSRFIEGLSI